MHFLRQFCYERGVNSKLLTTKICKNKQKMRRQCTDSTAGAPNGKSELTQRVSDKTLKSVVLDVFTSRHGSSKQEREIFSVKRNDDS